MNEGDTLFFNEWGYIVSNKEYTYGPGLTKVVIFCVRERKKRKQLLKLFKLSLVDYFIIFLNENKDNTKEWKRLPTGFSIPWVTFLNVT